MSPPLIKTPNEAAIPVPTMTAVGVARPKAHGQAITRVEIPKLKANEKSLMPSNYNFSYPKEEYTIENHIIQSITANMTMIGTKYLAILSATPWIGALAD